MTRSSSSMGVVFLIFRTLSMFSEYTLCVSCRFPFGTNAIYPRVLVLMLFVMCDSSSSSTYYPNTTLLWFLKSIFCPVNICIGTKTLNSYSTPYVIHIVSSLSVFTYVNYVTSSWWVISSSSTKPGYCTSSSFSQ